MSHPTPRFAMLATLGAVALTACTTEPKPATALSFFVQPSNGTVGQVIAPPIEIGFIDSDRNQVTTGIQANITVQLVGVTGGALSGTLTRPTVNAVATFDDLRVSAAGAGYALVAVAEPTPCDPDAVECQSDSEFPPMTSNGFNIAP